MIAESILEQCFNPREQNQAEQIVNLSDKCHKQAEEITEMRETAEWRNKERKALNILVACDGPCNSPYMDDPGSVDGDVVRLAVRNALRLAHWWQRGGIKGMDDYTKRHLKLLEKTKVP